MLREGLAEAGDSYQQLTFLALRKRKRLFTTFLVLLPFSGLSTYMMAQPCGFHCQEAVNLKKGFYNMPEYPFALGKTWAPVVLIMKQELLSCDDLENNNRPSYTHRTSHLDSIGLLQIRARGFQGRRPLHWRVLWL